MLCNEKTVCNRIGFTFTQLHWLVVDNAFVFDENPKLQMTLKEICVPFVFLHNPYSCNVLVLKTGTMGHKSLGISGFLIYIIYCICLDVHLLWKENWLIYWSLMLQLQQYVDNHEKNKFPHIIVQIKVMKWIDCAKKIKKCVYTRTMLRKCKCLRSVVNEIIYLIWVHSDLEELWILILYILWQLKISCPERLKLTC